MANNPPLYPGYAPQKPGEIQNPLYPGYYPGKPFARRPAKPKNFIKPIPEFGVSNIYESYLDEFGENIEKITTGVPKWISERMADDFKQAFKAAIKPESISLDTLDDLNADALPGAFGISVNLDPREWIKDPVKMAKKTAEGWWKAAANFDDIADREKRIIWAKLTLDDGGVGKGPEELTYPGETILRDLVIPKSARKNPFALTNRGVLGDDTPPEYSRIKIRGGEIKETKEVLKEDVFYKVRSEFLGFIENADAFHTRDKKLESFSRACNKAVSTELYQKQFDVLGINLNQELDSISSELRQSGTNVDEVLSELTKVAKDSNKFIGMDRLWEAAHSPEERTSIVSNVLLNLDGILASRNVAGTGISNDVIGKTFKNLADKVKDAPGGIDITEFLLRNKVEQSLGSLDFFSGKMKAAIASNFTENPDALGNRAHFNLFATELGKTEQHMNAYMNYLENAGRTDAQKLIERDRFMSEYGNYINKQLRELNSNVGEFKGAISEFKDVTKQLASLPGGSKEMIEGNILIALMTGVSRAELTNAANQGEDAFKTLLDNHLGSLGEIGIRRKTSHFQDLLEKGLGEKELFRGGLVAGDFPGAPGILEKMTNETSSQLVHGSLRKIIAGKGLNAEDLPILIERARLDAQVSKVGQIVTYLDHPEKIAEALLWKKISKKIFPTYSYSVYSFKDFVRVGLTQVHHLGLIINDGVLYKNKGLFGFDPQLRNAIERPNRFFGHYFKVEIKDFNFSGTFFGGGHFDILGVDLNGEEGFLKKILDKSTIKAAWSDDLLGDVLAGKIKVFENGNINIAFVTRISGGIPGFSKDDFGTFQANINKLREYLLANGCTLDQVNDPKFMLTMINKLNQINRDGGKITRRYLGLLEKLYYKVNAMQAGILKGPLTALWKYGFGLKGYVKNIYRELVRKLWTKLSAKILSTLLLSLGGAIVAVVIWLGEKIVDFLFNLFNNLKKMFEKGDFELLLESAEEFALRWLKRIGFIIFILLIISNIMGINIIPSLNIFGGTLNDPFSEGIPFSLSTFASSDDTRQYSSMLQSFDWNIYLDEYGQVPGGIGLPSGGPLGPGPGSGEIVDCFDIRMDATYTAMFKEAIKTLQTNTGSYTKRLCSGAGTIVLLQDTFPPKDDGDTWCGWVIGGNQLLFYTGHSNCGWSQNLINNLLAHETAHIYDNYYPDVFTAFANKAVSVEGVMGTYPYNEIVTAGCSLLHSPASNMIVEDFAETVGNMIARVPNTNSCIYGIGIDSYPAHYNFASQVIFAP